MNQDLPPSQPQCRVMAAGTLTTYQVAGRGLPLLVLTTDQEARARLLSRLSSSARVVAPDLTAPASAADAASWLAAFVEALGMTQVRVIADSDYEGAVRSLALTDPDRVGTLLAMHHAQGALD